MIFIAAAPHIVGIFTNDPVVLGHGVRGLRIISAGFAFYAYGMTFTQSLNGAGATWAPTWLNGVCFWAFRASPGVGASRSTPDSGPLARTSRALLPSACSRVASGAVFRRGAWKTVCV